MRPLFLTAVLLLVPPAFAETTPGPYDFLGLPKNTAETRAAQRPPFSMSDPAGPVFTEEEKTAQRAAGEALLEQLRAARGTLTIPPGDYRLPCRQPVVLENLNDVVVEAAGATLWLERPPDEAAAECWGLKFLHCRNVTLRGLVVDYDPPLYMQGRVTSLDMGTGALEVEADPGFPAVDFRPLQIIFFRPDGAYIPQPPHFHNGVTVAEGRTLRTTVKTIAELRRQSSDPKILEAFGGRSKIGAGDWAVLPFRTGTALWVEQCAAMTFEDVTLHAAPGFAFLESGGAGGHTYRRCGVVRRPGTNRLWAGNADAFHSRMLEKGPLLEGCEFAHIGDDFLNLHSFWHLAAHRFAPNQYVLFPHMYEPFRVGATIEFFDQVSAASQGEAVITALEPLTDAVLLEKTRTMPEKYGFIPYHGTPVVAALDRDVRADEGSLVDARALDSPGAAVRDCYFHDTMGRGALVEGVRDMVLEDNTWRDCSGGVLMFSCMWFYVEGPAPKNTTVRNNRFLNADALPAPVQRHQPVNGTICMTLVANGGNYPRTVLHNTGLTVTGNVLYRPMNYPVLAAYTRGVEVAGNRIIEPRHYLDSVGYDESPVYYSDADGNPNPSCAIFVTQSTDVRVGGNRIEGPAGAAAREWCFGPGVSTAKE